jgi:hypothetical protein
MVFWDFAHMLTLPIKLHANIHDGVHAVNPAGATSLAAIANQAPPWVTITVASITGGVSLAIAVINRVRDAAVVKVLLREEISDHVRTRNEKALTEAENYSLKRELARLNGKPKGDQHEHVSRPA